MLQNVLKCVVNSKQQKGSPIFTGQQFKKDISSTIQNFTILNVDALKCVKLRCYYKAAKRFHNNSRTTILQWCAEQSQLCAHLVYLPIFHRLNLIIFSYVKIKTGESKNKTVCCTYQLFKMIGAKYLKNVLCPKHICFVILTTNVHSIGQTKD